jgi:glycosyltransferase involved in cell wall biosynthesis
MLPRISIVTPSFNQAAYINETIQSVLEQNYPNLEYFVIDGGSTDGTLEILGQYNQHLDWLSEPDEGQTQAINKGFRKSTGEIVAWLNSDDLYLPNTLHQVANFFSQHPDIDVVYGDYLLIDYQGKVLLRKQEIPFDYHILLHGLNYISQPATFFKRSLFDRVSYPDESLHYGMDWEYWLRIAFHGGKFFHLPHYLAAARWHAQSKTLLAPPQMFAEFQAIRTRYWPSYDSRAGRWQKMYLALLNKIYRGKRQVLKLLLRHTIDFPPGHWVMQGQHHPH